MDGQDLFALSEDDWLAAAGAKVGFVFQSFQPMGNLTALENVMRCPLELADARCPQGRCRDMLERGLGQFVALPQRCCQAASSSAWRWHAALWCSPFAVGRRAHRQPGLCDGESIMRLMFEPTANWEPRWCW